jgi:adenylate cyclase
VSTQEIPEGTVTVLFTDLVESTQLNQSLGDDAARKIGRQVDELARHAVASNRGALIKEMGDGLMAAFSSARRAIAAAREMQVQMRNLHRNGLDATVQMRIGLHTGEVIDEDGDLHGETVIIAKRIEGLAPAGGILASETVHGVLGTARDELVDQGAAELKGIAADWRLYLVPLPAEEDEVESGLADTVPTPYIGRATERDTCVRCSNRPLAVTADSS